MSKAKSTFSENEKAGIVSEFIDQMNQSVSSSTEAFLVEYPGLVDEIQPLLNFSLNLKTKFESIKLSEETVQSKFIEFNRRIIQEQKAAVGVALDRRPDFLLLLLKMMDGVKGITRLTKLLFLMGKEARFDLYVEDFYAHAADNFGPFDDVIYQDIEGLKKYGLITEKSVVLSSVDDESRLEEQLFPNRVQMVYGLTESGKRYTEELFKKVEETKPEIIAELKKIISKYGRTSLNSLLKHVYTDYPEYTTKSKIKNQILGTKKNEKGKKK